MRSLLLATIASMGLVGCVGNLEPGPGTPDDNDVGDGSGTNPNPQGDNSQAKKMFDDNVYPIIASKTAISGCAAAGCHMIGNTPGSTQFVAQTAQEGWATTTSFTSVVGAFTPSTAAILTKIDAGHNARTYSGPERQAITDWLAQEALERANGGGGGGGGTGTESPGAATARLMNAWSSCLAVTDFQTANMSNAWNNMTAGGSACRTCHGTGAYNMIITPITETAADGSGPPGMFTTIATVKEYMIMWFTVDLSVMGPDGKKGKIIINQTAFDGVANGVAPHSTHPRYNSTNNNGMTALKSWYDLTMAKVTAAGATGNCGTTKLNPPAM